MRKYFTFLLIFPLSYGALYAQLGGNATSPLAVYGGGDGMRVVDLPKPPEGLGDALYLFPEWTDGAIRLATGQTIKSCTLRCDLANELLEIKDKNNVFVVNFTDLDEFRLIENYKELRYLGGKHFKINGKESQGVYEVLVEGKHSLVSRTSVNVVRKNGGFTDLQRGDAGTRTIRSEKFYSVRGGDLTEINSMASLLRQVGGKADEVKTWVKENRKKTKNKRELIEIWNYYLTLLPRE